MSLTDIMSHSDLSVFPQIALVIFLSVFALTAVRTYFSSKRINDSRHAVLPLDDGKRISSETSQEHHHVE